ncbi:MAG: zeta toxin family protein [Alphaproteobacteria bacterium]
MNDGGRKDTDTTPNFIPDLVSGLTRKKYSALRDVCVRAVIGEGPSRNPERAVFTGGLSGLGKTTMVDMVLRLIVDGVIDANDLRLFHPRYPEYMNEYGSEMARDLTRDFCDLLAVDIQNEALIRRRSFVREGTLQLPITCIPEAMQAATSGRDVIIAVLVGQAGDEELGRHHRHWEMRGDKERLALTDAAAARLSFVREIEHTYDDARAQSSILFTLSRIEEGLKDHALKAPGRNERIPAHRIIVIGTDGDIKYVNDFSDPARQTRSWEACAAEYDRPRRPQETDRLSARVVRTRALMHNFGANDKEWLVFQRLVDHRLARSLPGSHTARPQRELARMEEGVAPKFDPVSVWNMKVTEKLKEIMERPAVIAAAPQAVPAEKS